jgi:hypothetical protein
MKPGRRLRGVLAACGIAAVIGCGRGPAQESKAPLPPPHLKPEDVTMRLQRIADVMAGAEVPAVPSRAGVAPPFNGEPTHLRLHFDGDELSPEVDYRERQLLIYPLDEYRNQFAGAERDSFDARLDRFRTMLQEKPSKPIERVLVLPAVGSEPAFQARLRYIYFQDGNGLGVRFLTYVENPKYPSIKKGLFYTFQGIVGGRYVALFWPISIEDLPEGRSVAKTLDFIDGLTEEEMKPSLKWIDDAIESLVVQEPAASS